MVLERDDQPALGVWVGGQHARVKKSQDENVLDQFLRTLPVAQGTVGDAVHHVVHGPVQPVDERIGAVDHTPHIPQSFVTPYFPSARQSSSASSSLAGSRRDSSSCRQRLRTAPRAAVSVSPSRALQSTPRALAMATAAARLSLVRAVSMWQMCSSETCTASASCFCVRPRCRR